MMMNTIMMTKMKKMKNTSKVMMTKAMSNAKNMHNNKKMGK